MLNKFQPATVPVQVTHTPGDLLTASTTRSQSGGCRITAGYAAETGQADAPEAGSEKTQGNRRSGSRSVGIPGSSPAARAHAGADALRA